MISIQRKEDCCGCSACQQICPQKCITFKADEEGFPYPHIDLETCIDCHLCENVCPVLNQEQERTPIEVYAAYNNNQEIRANSSSGGIFTLVAEEIIDKNGVVFGVRWDSDWNAVFDYTTKKEDLHLFRGSKYVQAQLGDKFQQVKEFLLKQIPVLFTGTPCQIAGLRRYLKKDYEHLLLMDLICEGVPSPKVWQKYLSEEICCFKKAYRKFHKKDRTDSYIIDNISFRDKEKGWKSFGLTIYGHFCSDLMDSPIKMERRSPYLLALFNYLDLRPICYTCPFKKCKSYSDITIADYWGIHVHHPEMDDNKGTSMVFVNTNKGKDYLPLEKTTFLKTSYEENFYFNNIVTSVKKHRNRDKFYLKIDECDSIKTLLSRCTFPLSYKTKELIKKMLSRIISKKLYHKLESVWRRAKKSRW